MKNEAEIREQIQRHIDANKEDPCHCYGGIVRALQWVIEKETES